MINVCAMLSNSCLRLLERGADVHMTTMATLSCTCNGECGGHFRFIGNRDEATEKLPFNAGEELIQARKRLLWLMMVND